jgi:hypothetical protein
MSLIRILAAKVLAIHSRPDNGNDKSDRNVHTKPHNYQLASWMSKKAGQRQDHDNSD